MSIIPPSLVLPFYREQLYSRISVRNANEEIAVPLLHKQLKKGGGTSDGRLLKRLAGSIGGVTRSISSAVKKAIPNAKTPRRGVRAASPPELQGTLDKWISGKQLKGWIRMKSAPHGPHERIHNRSPTTSGSDVKSFQDIFYWGF